MPGNITILSTTLVLATMLCHGARADACDPGIVDIRHDGARVQFKVDLADDDAERARGLMFVEEMPRFSGMLFVYDHPTWATFWMKNTFIPLDMLFIDKYGTVKGIHENAVPHDETTIDGGRGIFAVLEINGGLSRTLGLAAGAEIRHPAFDGFWAAWPCDE